MQSRSSTAAKRDSFRKIQQQQATNSLALVDIVCASCKITNATLVSHDTEDTAYSASSSNLKIGRVDNLCLFYVIPSTEAAGRAKRQDTTLLVDGSHRSVAIRPSAAFYGVYLNAVHSLSIAAML